jgi:hypothetical protein
VRAAEAHRHAEALRRAERDVGAHGAGALEQHQRQQVAGDRDHGALGLELGDRRREVDAPRRVAFGYCSSAPKQSWLPASAALP